MFPVEAEDIRRRIVEEIIPTYANDNRRSRLLRADGTYARPPAAEPPHRSQQELLELAATRDRTAHEGESLPLSFEAISEHMATNGEALRERSKRKRKRGSAPK
jgi:hypothetical protein